METQVTTAWDHITTADGANVSEDTTSSDEHRMCISEKNGRTQLRDGQTDMVYIMGDLLGKGGFAKVYKLTSTASNHSTVAAGKIISKSSITKSHHKEKVAREVDIHRRMRHENVVQFYSFFEDQDNVFIILEYCGTKTLSSILKTRKNFTEPEVRYYLRQIIAGCQHIHQQGVVHRDLKLSNLFLTDSMKVKIGDFGLSAYINTSQDKKETICGTPNYISPEVLTKSGHSYPVDVWAIGCIIYALIVGRPPFETSSLKDTYKLISRSRYQEPKNASGFAKNLIAKCLRVNPSSRPKLEQIETDSFLTNGFTPHYLSQNTTTAKPDFNHASNQVTRLPPPSSKNAEPTDYLSFSELVKQVISSVVKEHICAEGGKDSVIEQADKCCRNLLAAIKETIDALKERSDCDINPKPVEGSQCTWVAKWVDYSHKYGFGYQLSNQVSGANFKDGLSIAVNRDFGKVGLKDCHGTTLDCATTDLPLEYTKKYQVMTYFVKYMNETLICGGDLEHEEEELALSQIFLYRWLRTKQAIAMYFSIGILQINFFHDHTKIAVSQVQGKGYQLMYINGKRNASVYNLTDVRENGCTPEIRERLEYACFQLNTMLTKTSGQLSSNNSEQG